MSTAAFKSANREGRAAQKWVTGMFKSWGLQVDETPRGYNPKYDLLVFGNLKGVAWNNRVEVKYDKLSAETGNIYLDINSLSKSEASLLVLLVGKLPEVKAHIAQLDKVLEFAKNWPGKVKGGEWGETSALVPIQVFEQLEFVVKL